MESAKEIVFSFNGKQISTIEGLPVAAALMENGVKAIRRCDKTNEARGIYCGIGHCFECRATIDGIPNRRTCLTLAKNGMVVTTNVGDDDQ